MLLTHPTDGNKRVTSKDTQDSPKSTLSLQDLRQSQSPETVPVCIVVRYSPHDNSALRHSCGVIKKSNEPSVCHKLWSILGLLVRVLLTDHRMSAVPSRAKYRHFITI